MSFAESTFRRQRQSLNRVVDRDDLLADVSERGVAAIWAPLHVTVGLRRAMSGLANSRVPFARGIKTAMPLQSDVKHQVMGPSGKLALLEAVRSEGSMTLAARHLGMSYLRASLLMENINDSPFPADPQAAPHDRPHKVTKDNQQGCAGW
jgi:hypothetical protein